MITLHILTRCTRTRHLERLWQSINRDSQFKVTWWVLFDSKVLKFLNCELLSSLQDSGVNLRFFKGEEGDHGFIHLNRFLQELEGYIYILDDDTLLHEDFYDEVYSEISSSNKQVIVFDQAVDGKDWTGLQTRLGTPEEMKVSQVDIGQIVFNRLLIGSIKFIPREYRADGFFIEELFKRHPEEFVFLGKTLSYYNYLS